VAGVLGGYALLYPRARVVTLVIIVFFITLIRLPALVVLGVFGLLAIRLFANRVHEDYTRSQRTVVY
jgi:hypothetical protein